MWGPCGVYTKWTVSRFSGPDNVCLMNWALRLGTRDSPGRDWKRLTLGSWRFMVSFSNIALRLNAVFEVKIGTRASNIMIETAIFRAPNKN